MPDKKGVSFIGGGNMAGAIIDAIISSGILPPSKISVFEPSDERRKALIEKEVNIANSNLELVSTDDILFIAVKPQVFDSVLEEIRGKIKSTCIVSIAAGISKEHIKSKLGDSIPVIRALPNTPMLILDGMTVLAKANDVSGEIFEFVESIFSAAGEVLTLPEEKINEAIPLSSSSPAFFFRMLDAMANSALEYGVSYEDALKLSAVAMKGSANYLLTCDKTPEELVAQVSSPGGTTVAALTAFDDFDFEKFISEAFRRCINRAYELGEQK